MSSSSNDQLACDGADENDEAQMNLSIEHVGLAARDTGALRNWYVRVLGVREGQPLGGNHHPAGGRFPLPTTEEWGEGKGEGIPISLGKQELRSLIRLCITCIRYGKLIGDGSRYKCSSRADTSTKSSPSRAISSFKSFVAFRHK